MKRAFQIARFEMTSPDPVQQRQFATQIVHTLREAGYVALWAGGCVRDQLLGLTPKDYDVATSATPEQIREVFGQRRTLAIGASFGVIVVLGTKNEGQIDVATFRQDAEYSDGRRPDRVTFSTPELDAQRRDFTINGLFYDPECNTVIDYVGGEEDIGQGIVRAIGDASARIAEDKLRMLRGVRFAATFDFELEPATQQAISASAASIRVVSSERIAAEMERMLVAPTRVRALVLLHETGLLNELLPEVTALASGTGTAWEATLRVLGQLRSPTFPLALAALLHRAGEGDLGEAVGLRWKLSGKDTQRAAWLLDRDRRRLVDGSLPWSKLQRTYIHDGFEELVQLVQAIADGDPTSVARARELLALPPERFNPPPLVSGNDLVAHGIRPGKQLGSLLEQIRDAQLDGAIHSAGDAFALADRLLANDDKRQH